MREMSARDHSEGCRSRMEQELETNRKWEDEVAKNTGKNGDRRDKRGKRVGGDEG